MAATRIRRVAKRLVMMLGTGADCLWGDWLRIKAEEVADGERFSKAEVDAIEAKVRVQADRLRRFFGEDTAPSCDHCKDAGAPGWHCPACGLGLYDSEADG